MEEDRNRKQERVDREPDDAEIGRSDEDIAGAVDEFDDDDHDEVDEDVDEEDMEEK